MCTHLAKLQNDATTCFDKMIRNLTTLYCRRFSYPEKVCKLQATALRVMKYSIQISLGRSDTSDSNTEKTPLHGTGQGSGVSGSNWLFSSVPMFQIIEKRCQGRIMNSPDKSITIEKHILGLDDDTRQYTNDWNNNNMLIIINNLQEASQIWEQLLNT